MLTSLSIIFLAGLLFAYLSKKLHLPRIIGMLLAGILIGPYALNLLDPSILSISADLRRIALIIILIKAGLSLNLQDLKKIGRPAVLMAFLPALFEIAAFTAFAPRLLSISRLDAAIMGAVLGAVSPAVVVPRMVSLIENGYGTRKGIPQLILAGASLDDVFVIVLFTSFISRAQGTRTGLIGLMNIPVSIVLGILVGIMAGIILAFIFQSSLQKSFPVQQGIRVLIVLGAAFLLMAVEQKLDGVISISGLLSIMAMACTIKNRCASEIPVNLSKSFGELWLGAEILLFVLVGAAVDIRYTLKAGPMAIAMIAIALSTRCLGVLCCMIGTGFNKKEKLFCIFSYLPKATVQAAIGGIPLSLGLDCGSLVLSVAVLSILLTAPLGAILMDASYQKLLQKEDIQSVM